MREAPSSAIVQALEDAGAKRRAYDPEGIEQARPMMPEIEFSTSPYEAAKGADAVVLVTEWDVLRALDLKRLAAAMAAPVFVDLRNDRKSDVAGKSVAVRVDLGGRRNLRKQKKDKPNTTERET